VKVEVATAQEGNTSPLNRQRSRSRRNDDQAEQEGRKEQTQRRNTFSPISIVTGAPIGAVLGAAIGAVVGVIVLGVVGLILSQYSPVFGGFIELNLAQPWSPARMNLIPVHLFVFGITGLVLGAGAGFLLGLLLGAGAGSLFGYNVKTEGITARHDK
jgi:uncharacterized membrane protein